MDWKRKLALLIVGVLLLGLGSFLYWETELPLSDTLPGASWEKARILQGNPDSPGREELAWEVTGPELEALLGTVVGTRVSRGARFQGMSRPYLQLVLYADGASAAIYVVEDGRGGGMDANRRQYYEGGGKLYERCWSLLPAISKYVYSAVWA